MITQIFACLRSIKCCIDEHSGVSTALHTCTQQREEHLRAIMTFNKNQDQLTLHNWLHENLIIIDTKANTILAVNSIAVATLTIFYTTLDKNILPILRLSVLAALLLLIWSIIPLAKVAFVYWSTTKEFSNPDEMLSLLLKLRDDRTYIIRASTIKGVIAYIIFSINISKVIL
jgi:hypothetical protein